MTVPDDATLAQWIDEADATSLLPAIAHATADAALLRDELHLDPTLTALPNGGWTDDQLTLARSVAFDALRAWLGAGRPAPAVDGPGLRRIVEWTTGAALDDDQFAMFTEELGLHDHRAPDWHMADHADGTRLLVAIIGAGMSGIIAAHRLGQAGIDVVILEKNHDVGGTWFENTYPGCRVDVPNHVYAYSNAQRADWPFHHSPQDVLLDYFRDCARRWGVTDLIRFGVRVDAMVWHEDRRRWTLDLHTVDGPEQLQAHVVVSAVGQLNQARIPDIAGIDTFAGESFHSSRWPADLDIAGRDVAVIGTGASAMQFIPHLAEAAAHLTVFQRTPAWLLPRPEYHEPLPDGLLRLFELIPHYAHWFRLRRFWMIHHGALDALHHDPDWEGPVEQAVSADNDLMRVLLTDYLHEQFADRPDLLEQVVPQYPVGAKRVVLDNGVWARTLKRPNVTLVSDTIDEVTPTGVRAGAVDHHADLIVYGTGFDASRFLMPMRITGRDGIDLHEHWGDDARAYLGMTVPGFPNLFCLYGPNTNIVINGSIIYFSECSARYLVECIRLLVEGDRQVIEVRPEVHAAFVERVDAANAEMAWGLSSVNSWYKSPSGRIAQNWPFALVDYWRETRRPDPADYSLA